MTDDQFRTLVWYLRSHSHTAGRDCRNFFRLWQPTRMNAFVVSGLIDGTALLRCRVARLRHWSKPFQNRQALCGCDHGTSEFYWPNLFCAGISRRCVNSTPSLSRHRPRLRSPGYGAPFRSRNRTRAETCEAGFCQTICLDENDHIFLTTAHFLRPLEHTINRRSHYSPSTALPRSPIPFVGDAQPR